MYRGVVRDADLTASLLPHQCCLLDGAHTTTLSPSPEVLQKVLPIRVTSGKEWAGQSAHSWACFSGLYPICYSKEEFFSWPDIHAGSWMLRAARLPTKPQGATSRRQKGRIFHLENNSRRRNRKKSDIL